MWSVLEISCLQYHKAYLMYYNDYQIQIKHMLNICTEHHQERAHCLCLRWAFTWEILLTRITFHQLNAMNPCAHKILVMTLDTSNCAVLEALKILLQLQTFFKRNVFIVIWQGLPFCCLQPTIFVLSCSIPSSYVSWHFRWCSCPLHSLLVVS